MVTGTQEPVLLGGYAAKQCPVRVQNDFLPLVPTLEWVPSPEDQARLDAGIAFERNVFADLAALHPTAVVVDPQLPKADAIAMTVQAMDEGAPLVLGGWLPDDVEGGRKGRPDILIKAGRGYLPADVKHHFTLKRAKVKNALVSSLASPDERLEAMGWTATAHRYEDGLQLGHYTRMLQACGYHPGPEQLWGAVAGHDSTGGDTGPGFGVGVRVARPRRAAVLHVLSYSRQDAALTAREVRPRTGLPRQGGRHRPACHGCRR